MSNGSSLSDAQLFVIESLNKIHGFMWPEQATHAAMDDRDFRVTFFIEKPISDIDKFVGEHCDLCCVFFEHPDWRNSLITREQFDSVDGWVRNDGKSHGVYTAVDVMFESGGISADVFAGDYDWSDGDIKYWRYHKPAKENKKQNNKSINQLITVWQQAKANADTSRAILQLAEKEEHEARDAVNKALRSAGWGVQ